MYTDWEYPVLPMVLSFEDYPPEISNRYPTKPFLKVEKHLQKRPPHLQGIYRFYSKNFGSVEFEKKNSSARDHIWYFPRDLSLWKSGAEEEKINKKLVGGWTHQPKIEMICSSNWKKIPGGSSNWKRKKHPPEKRCEKFQKYLSCSALKGQVRSKRSKTLMTRRNFPWKKMPPSLKESSKRPWKDGDSHLLLGKLSEKNHPFSGEPWVMLVSKEGHWFIGILII